MSAPDRPWPAVSEHPPLKYVDYADGRSPVGQCFHLSWWAVRANNDRWVLVHGTVARRGDRERIAHAWLVSRCGKFVYDPVLGGVYDRQDYMRRSEAIEVQRYSRAAAANMEKRIGHCGPWAPELWATRAAA